MPGGSGEDVSLRCTAVRCFRVLPSLPLLPSFCAEPKGLRRETHAGGQQHRVCLIGAGRHVAQPHPLHNLSARVALRSGVTSNSLPTSDQPPSTPA